MSQDKNQENEAAHHGQAENKDPGVNSGISVFGVVNASGG